MRHTDFSLPFSFSTTIATLFSLAALSACGGGGPGDLTTKVPFESVVSFGDSLSDIGSYRVGAIAELGGGQFSINSMTNGHPTADNWTELLAATVGAPALCPAQTGLKGSAPGFNVPPVMHPECTSYAMGGARVTSPLGPGNPGLGGQGAQLGLLTVPVVTQIQNHLAAHGGTFSVKELVLMMVGGNDAIFYYGAISAGLMKPPAAYTGMKNAATTLASYITTQILGKGAKYVVVVNLPDLSTTPMGLKAEAAVPGSQAIISTMVTTFNATLQAELGTQANLLYVDAYKVSTDQVVNPKIYGLSNVTDMACNVTAPGNAIGSSLVCNSSNLNSGDVSHYQFADVVHPTPYGYWLLARYVASQMAIKGWL